LVQAGSALLAVH